MQLLPAAVVSRLASGAASPHLFNAILFAFVRLVAEMPEASHHASTQSVVCSS